MTYSKDTTIGDVTTYEVYEGTPQEIIELMKGIPIEIQTPYKALSSPLTKQRYNMALSEYQTHKNNIPVGASPSSDISKGIFNTIINMDGTNLTKGSCVSGVAEQLAKQISRHKTTV